MKQKSEKFPCMVHFPDHWSSETCPLGWVCWQMTELQAFQRNGNLTALSTVHGDWCQPGLHENLSRRTKQNEPQCLSGALSLWKSACEGSKNSLFLCFPDHPMNRPSVSNSIQYHVTLSHHRLTTNETNHNRLKPWQRWQVKNCMSGISLQNKVNTAEL